MFFFKIVTFVLEPRRSALFVFRDDIKLPVGFLSSGSYVLEEGDLPRAITTL